MTINKLVVSLLLRKPYFGYILSTLKMEASSAVPQMDLVTGPTIRLIYNPRWLEELDEKSAFGAILHELLHIIFLHPIRRGERDKILWALACDLAVNENIEQELLPDGYITVERLNREMKNHLIKGRSAEYYYKAIGDEDFDESVSLKSGKNEMILRFPDEEEFIIRMPEERDLSEINCRAVESAMEEITRQAAEEGEIPGELRTQLQSLYGSVDVNWRNVLKKFMSGRGQMRIRKTVKKQSKRFDHMPGNKRHKSLEALVAIDESGSINDEAILEFYKELRMIKRMTKADINVIRFDTDCTSPVPLEKYLKVKDRLKRGGTDFRPVFSMADSIGSRLVILFTDGDGQMPDEVKQKVLWVMTGDSDRKPPFGETVRFSS